MGIFLDFSKAFDTIDHTILLQKLNFIKFSDNSKKWVANYLNNRKQATVIDDKISQYSLITCGVPQGSILGPTLFLVYINDLAFTTNILDPILYADDTFKLFL